MEVDSGTNYLTWDEVYSDDPDVVFWPDEPNPMVKMAKAWFEVGATIVDVPSGDGKNSFELANIGPVIACDTSHKALKILERRNENAAYVNIVPMWADAYSLPFVDDSVRSIFCCDLLGHLKDEVAVLQELRRVTAPNGIILANVFSVRDSVLADPAMRRCGDNSYVFGEKWFFRFYDESSAVAVFQASGLKVIEIQEITWVEGPHRGYREYDHEHTSWAVVAQPL